MPPLALRIYAPALGAGIFITLLLVSLAWVKALGDRQQLFEIEAAQIWQDAFQKIENSNEALESFGALYLSSIEVPKEQFQGFARTILARHPFIRSVVYLPRVSARDREEFEAGLRDAGFIGFSISQRGMDGTEPAANSPIYFPVLHVAPFSVDNTALLGFDAASEPALKAAIDRAIDAAAPVTGSGRIAEDQSGYWLFKAIYTGTEVPMQVADRRDRVNGVIAFLVDPAKLLSAPQASNGISASIDFGASGDIGAKKTDQASTQIWRTQKEFTKRFNMVFPGYTFGLNAAKLLHWQDILFGVIGFALLAGLSAIFALLVFAHGIAERARQQRMRADEIEREVQTKTRDLNESNQRTRMVIDHALDSVVTMDAQGQITDWNPRSEVVFGWTRQEAIGRDLAETILSPEQRETHRQGMQRFLSEGDSDILNRLIETTAIHRDGHEFPVELSMAAIWINGEYSFTTFLRDIKERKLAEARLASLANYDTLTGLPNRALFTDRLAQMLFRHERQPEHIFALMFLDLDHFKTTNDTLGHAVGDKLLQAAAGRIKECLRKVDTVSRLGGDEFTVILAEVSQATDAAIVAQKIIDVLSQPFRIEDNEIFISGSIGITICPHDANNAQDMLRNADTAMYQAKEQGRGKYLFFIPEMNQRVLERASLEKGLRKALERNEFELHYQPQVDLVTGLIIGMEALIRWRHPERGMVSPLQFIPLAEENGLIIPIGEWVLRTACAQTQSWIQAGALPLRIAVNLSGRQFRQQNLIQIVKQALTDSGLDPVNLELEITESLAMGQADKTIATLRELKAMGLKIAIDDFGTGYSSLSYLKRFPIDTLKIDRSFIKDITDDPDDAAITMATIVMSHSLKLRVIAEGVETPQQRAFLQQYGCDEAQGYYFSKPLPAHEFGLLLQKQPPCLP